MLKVGQTYKQTNIAYKRRIRLNILCGGNATCLFTISCEIRTMRAFGHVRPIHFLARYRTRYKATKLGSVHHVLSRFYFKPFLFSQ